jgi:hypothetical protein
MPKFIDLTGDQYSRLTVISQAGQMDSGHRRWLCRCSCGSEVTVAGTELRSGDTKSCGCLRRETTAKLNVTHKMTSAPEYRTWATIIRRCTNKNTKDYKYYGGRGISVCAEWVGNFEAFFQHVGKKPSPKYSIDRIDNNGNYEPGNVRWATHQQQMQNQGPRRAGERRTADLAAE